MTDDRFDQFADDIRYIRGRVDQHGDELKEFRVSVEQRMTRVEMKAGLVSLIAGALAALGVSWGKS